MIYIINNPHSIRDKWVLESNENLSICKLYKQYIEFVCHCCGVPIDDFIFPGKKKVIRRWFRMQLGVPRLSKEFVYEGFVLWLIEHHNFTKHDFVEL